MAAAYAECHSAPLPDRLIAPDHVGPDIRLDYCWAHARRKLVEITRAGSAPIAEEGVKRIGELYRIEAELRGLRVLFSPD